MSYLPPGRVGPSFVLGGRFEKSLTVTMAFNCFSKAFAILFNSIRSLFRHKQAVQLAQAAEVHEALSRFRMFDTALLERAQRPARAICTPPLGVPAPLPSLQPSAFNPQPSASSLHTRASSQPLASSLPASSFQPPNSSLQAPASSLHSNRKPPAYKGTGHRKSARDRRQKQTRQTQNRWRVI